MHIYFSGIGGTGIGPLALVAKQAGYEISGSDKQRSDYVSYLQSKGLEITIGQDGDSLRKLHKTKPIDWFVYSSALPKENPNHPELIAVKELGIKHSKRDEFLNHLLREKNLKLIAIAGTHGKTTTTAMTIWLMKQLNIPISYSVGAKISFGDMGSYDPDSEYFVYEADEYDRNFLGFSPSIAIIPGIAYDHPDIYPTLDSYNEAFRTFICTTLDNNGQVFSYDEDLKKVYSTDSTSPIDEGMLVHSTLVGEVNRKDALLVAHAVAHICHKQVSELITMMNNFPGVSRRFEKIGDNVYSDYAHTPEKIHGALQLAHELAGNDVVVVYEGLHNTRQHFIKDALATIFEGIKEVYVVPSYLAREDSSLELLTPEKIIAFFRHHSNAHPARLNEALREAINKHQANGDLVLCLSAGGGGSLDEWLRQQTF